MQTRGLIWNLLVLLAITTAGACSSLLHRVELLGAAAQMQHLELPGTDFQHYALYSEGVQGTRLVVFIEGDGTPWGRDGMQPAMDPTPSNPLALRLASRTPGPVLYLGRPCYFGRATATHCSESMWTSARYSEAVVTSMTTALDNFVRAHKFDSIVLVGHSGGGTLAVLMAPRVPLVTAVITVAANLDTAGWIKARGYLPLEQSLNPADLAPLPARITERHLIGRQDDLVEPETARRYTDRLSPASTIVFEDYGHVCCWERDWRQIWSRVLKDISATKSAAATTHAP